MASSSPLFIVGLPRSGSTLLSRILNDGKAYFSINDLYYVQAVQSINAMDDALSEAEVHFLTEKLIEVVETRALKNNSFIGQFSFTVEQLNGVRNAVLEQHKAKPYTWSTLLDGVLTRLADILGKKKWADKTPQNFMHLDILREAFPDSKILYLFRDPRMTLASLKYASGPGHDPRRYHPWLYALYWRTAVRSYLANRSALHDVYMIRYEDLLDNPEESVSKLNAWVGAAIGAIELESLGNNSSFGESKREGLTETEEWICNGICRKEMAELGYGETEAYPRGGDIPHILYLTCRSFLFQLHRLLFSADGRKRIMHLFKQVCLKVSGGK